MSIDIHNHVIPQSVLDLVAADSTYGVILEGGTWKSQNIMAFPLGEAWFSPEAKLAEMDGKDLDRAVLSVAPKPLYYYELDQTAQVRMADVANRGLADFCIGHEERLRWLAHLPLAYPEASVRVLSEAVEMGAVGVQIGTSAAGKFLDDRDFDVLWERLAQAGLPVFLHPAYESRAPEFEAYSLGPVIGMTVEVTTALIRLICGRVLDRYPDLKVVAALGGGAFPYNVGRLRHYITWVPALADSPKDPWSYVGQIKFDTHLHDPAALRFLIDKAGPENVLIGTDCSFPSATPEPMVELRDALGGDDAAFALVAETNALELFWSPRRGES